jgi:hypothetical protein
LAPFPALRQTAFLSFSLAFEWLRPEHSKMPCAPLSCFLIGHQVQPEPFSPSIEEPDQGSGNLVCARPSIVCAFRVGARQDGKGICEVNVKLAIKCMGDRAPKAPHCRIIALRPLTVSPIASPFSGRGQQSNLDASTLSGCSNLRSASSRSR